MFLSKNHMNCYCWRAVSNLTQSSTVNPILLFLEWFLDGLFHVFLCNWSVFEIWLVSVQHIQATHCDNGKPINIDSYLIAMPFFNCEWIDIPLFPPAFFILPSVLLGELMLFVAQNCLKTPAPRLYEDPHGRDISVWRAKSLGGCVQLRLSFVPPVLWWKIIDTYIRYIRWLDTIKPD